MNLGDAVLTLRVDDQGLSKGLDSAKQKADGLNVGIKSLVAGFATFATVRAVVKILGDCLDSFIESEMAATKLTSALRATGQEYTATSKHLQDFAGEMQKLSIYSDEAVMGAEAMLIQLANLTEAGVKEATPAVMDLAAAMGMDLESAATLVSKALAGNVGALSRYGIKIESSQDPTEQFDRVIQALTEHFGGMAVALGKTTGGQLEQFKNQVDEAKESVGGFLASFVRGYVVWGAELSAALQTIWWYMKQVWAVWSDITNLRNPFGKDSAANLIAMAERQKQLSEQMLIFEGLQTSGIKKTQASAKASNDAKEARDAEFLALMDLTEAIANINRAYDESIQLQGEMAAEEPPVQPEDIDAVVEMTEAIAKINRAYDESIKTQEEMGASLDTLADEQMEKWQDIASSISSAMKSTFQEIGRDLAAGELSWKSLGESALKVIGKIVSALGDQLAADAAADLVKAFAALASVFGAWMAPGYFASAAIKGAGAAAAWIAGSALQAVNLKTGGEFVVPPGYPDDSYRVNVASGERVSVIPAGAGGDMVHVTVNLDAQPILDAVTRGSRSRRVLIAARSVV